MASRGVNVSIVLFPEVEIVIKNLILLKMLSLFYKNTFSHIINPYSKIFEGISTIKLNIYH